MNGMPGAPSLWQEARNADGRVYYYNVQTKATQWAKPVELMTPVEVSLVALYLSIISIADILFFTESFGEPAIQRIHYGGWAQILVPHRDQAEHLGNA